MVRFGCSGEEQRRSQALSWAAMGGGGVSQHPQKSILTPTPNPGAASLPATRHPVSPGCARKEGTYRAGCQLVTWKRENIEEVTPAPVPPPQHPPRQPPAPTRLRQLSELGPPSPLTR